MTDITTDGLGKGRRPGRAHRHRSRPARSALRSAPCRCASSIATSAATPSSPPAAPASAAGIVRLSLPAGRNRAAAAKPSPDLQIQVMHGDVVLASSRTQYNAGPEVVLDVNLPDDAPLPSEYEALVVSIGNHFDGDLAQLQETDTQQDITYLANKTGVGRARRRDGQPRRTVRPTCLNRAQRRRGGRARPACAARGPSHRPSRHRPGVLLRTTPCRRWCRARIAGPDEPGNSAHGVGRRHRPRRDRTEPVHTGERRAGPLQAGRSSRPAAPRSRRSARRRLPSCSPSASETTAPSSKRSARCASSTPAIPMGCGPRSTSASGPRPPRACKSTGSSPT